MTLKKILSDFKQRLGTAYSPGEIKGIEMAVLENILGYTTVDAIMHDNDETPTFVAEKFSSIADRLLRHEPIQYILGDAYFYGRHFIVTPATLIPRPETAGLIDMIADENHSDDLQVLDIGTGSGCIAISLALTLRFAHVTAIDISPEALSVAKENAKRLKARVDFLKADILSMHKPSKPCYDIIVSNPPYIAESEKAGMDRNVLDYEPSGALFVPDDDPLRFYKALSRFGADALKPGGRLYFEINSRFPAEIKKMLDADGYVDVELLRDMQGLWRFARAHKRKD